MSVSHWRPNDETQLPSDYERVCTLDMIGQLEEALNVQRNKIKAHLDDPNQLCIFKREIKVLECNIYARRAYIAPVRRLNVDVVSLIAHETAKVDEQAPWKMATICRFWRRAVLTTPEAWCRVHVGPVADPVDLFQTALSRAGKCPLYVSIGSLTDPKKWEKCRDIAREQNNRLIQLKVDLMPLQGLNPAQFVTFPKMDTLSLRFTLPLGHRPRLKGKDIAILLCTGDMSAAPNLHHLNLYRYDISGVIYPALRNLTTLSLVSCVLSDFHRSCHLFSNSLRNLRLFDTSVVNSGPLESLGGGARTYSHPVPWKLDILESFEFYSNRKLVIAPRIQAPQLSYLLFNHSSPPIFENVPESLTHIHIWCWKSYGLKDILIQRDCFQKLTIRDGWQWFVHDVLRDQSIIPSKVTAIDLVAKMTEIMEHSDFQQMLDSLSDRLITIRILEPNSNGHHITSILTSKENQS